MAKLFVIYQQPADAAKFDKYYFNKHVPLAKTFPACAATKSLAAMCWAWQASTGPTWSPSLSLIRWLQFRQLWRRRRAAQPPPTLPILPALVWT